MRTHAALLNEPRGEDLKQFHYYIDSIFIPDPSQSDARDGREQNREHRHHGVSLLLSDCREPVSLMETHNATVHARTVLLTM